MKQLISERRDAIVAPHPIHIEMEIACQGQFNLSCSASSLYSLQYYLAEIASFSSLNFINVNFQILRSFFLFCNVLACTWIV